MQINKHDEKLLKEKYPNNYEEIREKITNNYPIQYLIGNVNFYGYPIDVNENVLIPRFETETLIEKTLNYIEKINLNNPNILDIGTGSGCIAITLKKEIECNVTGYDISSKALDVAINNAKKNNTDIKFIQKDILNEEINESFDIIISNPPYLTHNDIVGKEIAYEPQIALYAENKGIEFYEEIIKQASKIKPKLIAFETGENQKKLLVPIIKEYFPNAKISCENDLAGKERYIFIINE